ncbi:hypothetical protein TIFTF001_046003 [Ficus carica]|uniref:Uncharacterized protein n=1 Tax=Ficus carica TaxID=3494 RepID=A0AA88D3T2_FICCA|nr:hypothetical protein TIFTF001_046003 [Ficus carica]
MEEKEGAGGGVDGGCRGGGGRPGEGAHRASRGAGGQAGGRGWGATGGRRRERKGKRERGVAGDRPVGAGADGGGPEVSCCGREEKKEKRGRERKSPVAGCESLATERSPPTEKTLGGKYYVR